MRVIGRLSAVRGALVHLALARAIVIVVKDLSARAVLAQRKAGKNG
jgi:hypothetical protein